MRTQSVPCTTACTSLPTYELVNEHRSLEPTTDRKPSPCGDGPSRIGSTEAVPEGATSALYRRLSTECLEQSGLCSAKIRRRWDLAAQSRPSERSSSAILGGNSADPFTPFQS